MMKCDHRALEDLLNDCDAAEPQSEAADLAQHLANCEVCQRHLTDLAASDQEWHELSTWLSPAEPPDGVPAASLQAAETWQRPATWPEAMARSLLSPAAHPEMLGRIGRYDVERLIGSGGMGIVLKAHDTELHRPVAIKILAPYLAENGAARHRFAREARAAAAVVDDHVVPIHNVETDGSEIPFLVMQYVAGGSLQQRIDRQGPLEVAEILRVALHTAKGLAAAHAQGLIHRDVKPSNILLDETVERALLTDFGLARAANETGVTRTGFQPGTPQYMSPEQVRGEAIDARSDLFGLGCVMYALCTGHPPFQSETGYAVLRLITDSQPASVREVNADIPHWLDVIVMKLLQKEPAERFESADEVVRLLQACLSHVQNPASQAIPPELTVAAANGSVGGRWLKWLLTATAAFGLAVCGLLVSAELNKGTLTITSAEPGIPIRILQAGKVYDRFTVEQTKTSVRVAAGEYVVEIEGDFDGLIVQDEKVILKRGGEQLVRIVHESKQKLSESVSHKTDLHNAMGAVLTDVVDTRVLLRSNMAEVSQAREALRAGNLWSHVEQFNQLCKDHPVGREQPLLTVDEVRTAIRWRMIVNEDSAGTPVAEVFHSLLDSGMLPDGWTLAGEVVQLSDAKQRPLASAWRIRLANAHDDLKTMHVIREHYLRPTGGFDRERLKADSVVDADSDSRPLASALRSLNESYQRTIDGQQQPRFTMDEVLAAIRAWRSRRDEAPVVNRDFAAFQRIAETGVMPAGAEFEVLRSFGPGDDRVYFIYSVRIRMPQSGRKGWTFAYTIRERFISSRQQATAERRQQSGLLRSMDQPPDDAATSGIEALRGTWLHSSESGSTDTMKIFYDDEGMLMLKFLDASGQTQQGRLQLTLADGGTQGRFSASRRLMNRTVREWMGSFELKDELLRWQFNDQRNFEFEDRFNPVAWDDILRQPARPMFGEAAFRKCPADLRRVTFSRHLDKTVEEDPIVEPGEPILVEPDRADRLAIHDEVLMQLPKVTPYTGDDQLHYLQGWAVGRMTRVNGRSASNFVTGGAKPPAPWTAGWLIGLGADGGPQPIPDMPEVTPLMGGSYGSTGTEQKTADD